MTSASRPKNPSASPMSYGDEAQVRAAGRRFGARLACDQSRVLLQHRLLEARPARAPGRSPVRWRARAGAVQRPQRLALPAGLVLGGGEQRPPPFPQRRLGHPGLGFGQHVAVAARLERRVEAELLGVEAELLEASRLDPARVPAVEIAQRPAPPQSQRFGRQVRGPFRFAQRQQLAGSTHEALEPLRVDGLTGDDQPVAVGHGLDGVGARARDGGASRSPGPPCSRRRAAARPTAHPPVARRSSPRPGATPARRAPPDPGRQPGRIAFHRQRAEHPDRSAAHRRSVRPSPRPVNGTDNGLITRRQPLDVAQRDNCGHDADANAEKVHPDRSRRGRGTRARARRV